MFDSGTMHDTLHLPYNAVHDALDAALLRLDRLVAIAARAAKGDPEREAALLLARLAPDMFPFAQQVRTAARFTIRIAWPLADAEPPSEPPCATGLAGLATLLGDTRGQLAAAPPPGAIMTRRIAFRAGEAAHVMTCTDYLLRFGLPNLHFHLAMAYAILRAEGLEVGKADYDGVHAYPPGFRFG